MILVDTCVWSEALRKNKSAQPDVVSRLSELIQHNLASIIGPIRQELLSGVKNKKNFLDLKQNLSYFPDAKIETEDHEVAAEFYNICRKKGVQGSNTDFLICAVANRYGVPIFTMDKDFSMYSKLLEIRLYEYK